MSNKKIALGHDHYIRYYCWKPDDLPENRALYGTPLPDAEKAGVIVFHPHKKIPGKECIAGITFDIPETQRLKDPGARWQVQSWDPLTLSPSLLCLECGDHGFIQNGKWVPA